MKTTAVLFAALFGAVSFTQAQQITGAGATFPAPLYQRWSSEFAKKSPGAEVNYQSVGSGAGVKNFLQGVVDFGASDAAMTDDEIAKAPQGAVMIPVTAGSVVLAYNLPEVKDLKLSREALSGIFLGTIKSWNDPVIAACNPGVDLPNLPVVVAYRSDGSGTTFLFTQHLSAISQEFKDKVGCDKSVTFPAGIGGKGNEGVTALVKQTPGAIGYIEYGYAQNNNLPMAVLQNKAGKFVAPSPESGAAALASLDLPENLRAWPVDPAGEGDYPITSLTWILLPKKASDPQKMSAVKNFVSFALGEGQSFAEGLGYIPLPESVIAKSKAALASIQ